MFIWVLPTPSVLQENLLKNPSSGQCLALKGGQILMDCNAAELHQHWTFTWPSSLPAGWPLIPSTLPPFLKPGTKEPHQYWSSRTSPKLWSLGRILNEYLKKEGQGKDGHICQMPGVVLVHFKFIYERNSAKTFAGGWGSSASGSVTLIRAKLWKRDLKWLDLLLNLENSSCFVFVRHWMWS